MKGIAARSRFVLYNPDVERPACLKFAVCDHMWRLRVDRWARSSQRAVNKALRLVALCYYKLFEKKRPLRFLLYITYNPNYETSQCITNLCPLVKRCTHSLVTPTSPPIWTFYTPAKQYFMFLWMAAVHVTVNFNESVVVHWDEISIVADLGAVVSLLNLLEWHL